jgi:threonine dehydrogenase-like Zn-dependent dehydrogenase
VTENSAPMRKERSMQNHTVPSEMRALVWLGPHQMELQTLPTPVPTKNEVLIKVGAVGICGSELSGYLGHNSLRVPPLIMGHEAAGTIVAGSGVLADGTTVHTGQRVTFNPLISCGHCDRCKAGRVNLCRNRQLLSAHRPGAFAQYVVVPADLCWHLPEKISFTAGSLAEPLACAVHAVELAEAQSGQNMLILGAGPIGLCMIAAAKARGVKHIIVSDISDARLDVAKHWGATHAINAKQTDTVAATLAAYPHGVDIAIDAVGTGLVRNQAIKAVMPGGTVVLMGLHEDETAIPTNYIIRQEIRLIGSFCYSREAFTTAVDLIARHVVKATPDWLIERPMSDGRMSFEELLAGTAPVTKIVLKPND